MRTIERFRSGELTVTDRFQKRIRQATEDAINGKAMLINWGDPRELLRLAREQAGLSLRDLAGRVGCPVGVLADLEEGGSRASEKLIDALCRELPGLAPEDLLDGSDHPQLRSENGLESTSGAKTRLSLPPGMTGRAVPYVSMAQAGTWDANHSDALYDHTAIFAANVDDRQAFAIKVSGNSMEPELHEGDFVICSPSQELRNGEAAVIQTRSEQVFIKYWKRRGERVLLESANIDYRPIELPIEEVTGAWLIVQHIRSGRNQCKRA